MKRLMVNNEAQKAFLLFLVIDVNSLFHLIDPHLQLLGG